MTDRRYLPLFRSDGTWIDRPDLYLLARLNCPDSQDDEVEQIYHVLRSSDPSKARLGDFERKVQRWAIRQYVPLRDRAAEVVLYAWRIQETTHHRPSINQVLHLVALEVQRVRKQDSLEFVFREVRRGFTKYRSTAHLQAAFLLRAYEGATFEGDEAEGLRFLAYAKSLELVMDEVARGSPLKWDPWRVPESISPQISRPPSLTDEEVDALGLRS